MGVAHTRKSLVKGERFIRDVWKTWVEKKQLQRGTYQPQLTHHRWKFNFPKKYVKFDLITNFMAYQILI